MFVISATGCMQFIYYQSSSNWLANQAITPDVVINNTQQSKMLSLTWFSEQQLTSRVDYINISGLIETFSAITDFRYKVINNKSVFKVFYRLWLTWVLQWIRVVCANYLWCFYPCRTSFWATVGYFFYYNFSRFSITEVLAFTDFALLS